MIKSNKLKRCVTLYIHIFKVRPDRVREEKMFLFVCLSVERTDVNRLELLFIFSQTKTDKLSLSAEVSDTTAIFNAAFNVSVVLLREQWMCLLIFSIWFGAFENPISRTQRRRIRCHTDDRGKGNVLIFFNWTTLTFYIHNYCVGEFFCVYFKQNLNCVTLFIKPCPYFEGPLLWIDPGEAKPRGPGES